MRFIRKVCRWPSWLAALLLALSPSVGWAENPSRIVSLNLCADELLLRLADREDIASITFLAADSRVSSVSDQVGDLPLNRGRAEEILPLKPDLVLAEPYTTRSTVELLRRLEVPILDVAVPSTLEEVEAQVAEVSAALGWPDRGQAMIESMRQAQASLGPPLEGPRPLAAVYRPNGFLVGPGTLVDEILRLAGFRNLASEGLQNHNGVLSIETLLWHRPDLLVLNSIEEPMPSLAHEVLSHPALEDAFPDMQRVVVHPALWSCGGPGLMEALTKLRSAAKRLTTGSGE
ncbi:ABC transporter substrate-binding protein [Aquibaculum sediminis]|uniref:ABC transporter substrate-binding protein n=1 Tax=Aquibaculum sediminis TaxID=3231907 RepID=UPI00345190CE